MIRAKTLVKDKFWIIEQEGQKLGTLQKQEDNGWIFLSKQKERQVYHTLGHSHPLPRVHPNQPRG